MFHEPRSDSGPSIRFFAWLMRASAARGGMNLSSMFHDGNLVGRVVDHEIPRQPDFRRLATKQPRAERMERGQPDPVAVGSEHRLDALAHFACGLVRERDREHLFRPRMPAADQVRDAIRDNARLPRPCARKDQQRPVQVQHRLTLFRIQVLKEVHGREGSVYRMTDDG